MAKRAVTLGMALVLAAASFPSARGADPLDCAASPPEVSNPLSAEWTARDSANLRCAHQRLDDQLSNPAFHQRMFQASLKTYPAGLAELATDPNYLSITAARMMPGGFSADPFRLPDEWRSSGRGRVQRVRFPSTYAATKMEGDIFLPPPVAPAGGYPGVIFTTGGSHAYRHLYYWLSEGLAEQGYAVLIYDVPGQGGSESFGRESHGLPFPGPVCNPTPGPSPCISIFDSSVRDSLSFFLSSANPALAEIDQSKIGLMGHSIGAGLVNTIGQGDPRVKAIVNLDATGYLDPSTRGLAHAPMLLISSDYPSQRGPESYQSAPFPWDHQYSYRDLTCQAVPGGPPPCEPNEPVVDSMAIGLRAATHYDWAYLPLAAYPRSASRYGERVSLYYTLAWFDAYLKDSAEGFIRLTARSFDGSSDRSSIGAGGFDPSTSTNVPHKIQGQEVRQRLSFYFRSGYWLKNGALRCEDLRLDRRFEGSVTSPCDRA